MRALLAGVVATLGLAADAGAQLSALRPCDPPGLRCATLSVPLDRSGADPGRLRLRVGVQRGFRPGRDRLVIALTGGPGQAGVPYAGALATALQPLLRAGDKLAVLDQRGTGAAGALRCDRLQRLRGLDAFTPEAVGACGRALGPLARHLSTQDTVADLEDLRVALGARRLTLYGVSYGTFVAQQYARTHPTRVRALVLDSVLEPGGWDGFLLPLYNAARRVLRDQCARGRCRGITPDPVADLGAVAARVERAPASGRVPDARGRLRRVRLSAGEQLFFLLLAGDLNETLQAALPAALRAAATGDAAPLLRLVEAGQGARPARRDLSAATLVATDCADARLPYSLAAPPAERTAALDAALAAIPPAAYAPFGPATVRAASLADDCLRWPQQAPAATVTGPLPDVPAILFAGRLDLRTPLESARAAAALLPRAQVVAVPGVGHDVLGADPSGCAAEALRRWRAGRAAGRPCSGRLVLPPAPLPPRRIGSVRAALRATVRDAEDAVVMYQAAGLPGRGGGLRGGRFAATANGGLLLAGYEYVPGLRLSGRLDARGTGRLRVRGAVHGSVRLDGEGRVRGALTRSSRTAAARRAPGRPAERARRAAAPAATRTPPPRTPAR